MTLQLSVCMLLSAWFCSAYGHIYICSGRGKKEQHKYAGLWCAMTVITLQFFPQHYCRPMLKNNDLLQWNKRVKHRRNSCYIRKQFKTDTKSISEFTVLPFVHTNLITSHLMTCHSTLFLYHSTVIITNATIK